MRKMYFAMVPRRNILADTLKAAAVGAAAVYGAKRLLGEDQFNSYRERVREKFSMHSDAETETAESSVWGETPEPEKRRAARTAEDGTVSRVRGALRITKAASKLLFTANSKLLNILSKEDSEE